MDGEPSPPRRRPRILVILASGIFLVIAASFIPADYHEHICFHCRCEHESGTIAGIPYKLYHPTSMTRWYVQRFPGHLHQWSHLGHIRTIGLGGSIVSSVGGRSMMVNLLWLISEQEQLDYLKPATPDEAAEWTSLVSAHRQREAVNLVLGKQTPPRVLCDGIANFDCCQASVVLRSAAVAGEGGRFFWSARCRDPIGAR
jgi:hypothetical protein